MSSRMDTQFLRSALVLLGAFTCAFCLGITAHELGHAIAIRLFGVTEMRIILHPFGASRIIWDTDPALLGYVDAAGPLGNVLVGTGVMPLLWQKRSPYLLPLLIWGPMACVQEGVYQHNAALARHPRHRCDAHRRRRATPVQPIKTECTTFVPLWTWRHG